MRTGLAKLICLILLLGALLPGNHVAASLPTGKATVWVQEPRVPVLTYHQFMKDNAGSYSTSLKVRLSDFQAQLQALYDSGYSLVSIEDWLHGNMVVPTGRRPLILTMDDLFYNNQITLTKTGKPDPQTGIGLLWRFSQEHPEFGFNIALFAALGDKLYANPDDPNWQDDLARAIAWCIDHGAQVFNHFYTHPRLDQTSTSNVVWEAKMNDRYLRQLLKRIERQDLIPRLGNLVALPYGMWPSTVQGRRALSTYLTPEKVPLEGVFEIDYIIRPKFLRPVYSPKFDRWHMPRIVATQSAINYLVDHREDFPAAQECDIDSAPSTNPSQYDYLNLSVLYTIQIGKCPAGMYTLDGRLIDARNEGP